MQERRNGVAHNRNSESRCPPVVILIRPQLGENIGAAARAMSNFGLSELRLVSPRDGWPNEKAREMAAGAAPIIESAQVFSGLSEAMHDVTHTYATTARTREVVKRIVTPEEAAAEASALPEGAKAALLFGPERTGLLNEDLALADTLITIPTAANASLNLAQAVIILGYAWHCNAAAAMPVEPRVPAGKQEVEEMFAQLEAYLDARDYFRTPEKKPLMWLNLRNIFLRAQPDSQEVRTLRGMFRSLYSRGEE